MNKTYTTQVEVEEVCFIKLPEEFGFEVGDQFSIEETEEGFLLKPFTEVEIDLPDDLFMKLALEAHEQNLTFNQYCVNIISAMIDQKTSTGS